MVDWYDSNHTSPAKGNKTTLYNLNDIISNYILKCIIVQEAYVRGKKGW